MATTIVRYSDQDLQEFKALIDGKLANARQELSFMQEQIAELNENASEKQGGNWFDDSSINTELEMLGNMVIRQQQFVMNLENALIRIQNKTYGVCTVTGQLISKQRLLLVPHATKSVIAKEIENAEKAKQEAIAKAERDSKERAAVLGPSSEKTEKQTKIISKIVKKPSKSASTKSSAAKDDDLDDLDLELEMEEEESEFDDNIVTGMDMDDIADDQDYFDK